MIVKINNNINIITSSIEKNIESKYSIKLDKNDKSLIKINDSINLLSEKVEDLNKSYSGLVNHNSNILNDNNTFNEAFKNSDEKLCDNISDIKVKNNCNQTLLIRKLETSTNIKDCDQIIDKSSRDSCKNNIIKTNALNGVNTNINVNVSSKVLTIDDRIKLCNDITNLDLQISCKNNIYEKQALDNLDTTSCNKIIKDSYKKNLCIKKLNILKIKNNFN